MFLYNVKPQYKKNSSSLSAEKDCWYCISHRKFRTRKETSPKIGDTQSRQRWASQKIEIINLPYSDKACGANIGISCTSRSYVLKATKLSFWQ